MVYSELIEGDPKATRFNLWSAEGEIADPRRK